MFHLVKQQIAAFYNIFVRIKDLIGNLKPYTTPSLSPCSPPPPPPSHRHHNGVAIVGVIVVVLDADVVGVVVVVVVVIVVVVVVVEVGGNVGGNAAGGQHKVEEGEGTRKIKSTMCLMRGNLK